MSVYILYIYIQYIYIYISHIKTDIEYQINGINKNAFSDDLFYALGQIQMVSSSHVSPPLLSIVIEQKFVRNL